ncbi:MAG: methyltransferase domain-containing protein [Candidatus Aenigmatarchaeota archaeon]
MDKEKVLKKFGNADFSVNDKTYVMGINHILSRHIAERFKGFSRILEVCTGAGFMLIPLAKVVSNIVTVDINPENIEQAKNNLEISGVKSNVRFVLGDVMDDSTLANIEEIDAAFLDPDWSIVDDKKVHEQKLSSMQPPADKLFERIEEITRNIALRLPKELDLNELKILPKHELEAIYLDDKLKFYCIYFGKLAKSIGATESRLFSNSENTSHN